MLHAKAVILGRGRLPCSYYWLLLHPPLVKLSLTLSRCADYPPHHIRPARFSPIAPYTVWSRESISPWSDGRWSRISPCPARSATIRCINLPRSTPFNQFKQRSSSTKCIASSLASHCQPEQSLRSHIHISPCLQPFAKSFILVLEARRLCPLCLPKSRHQQPTKSK